MLNSLAQSFKNYKFALIINIAFASAIIFFGYYYKNFNLITQIIYSFIFFLAFLIPGYTILATKYFDNFKETEKFVFSFGISFFIYAILALLSGFIFSETLHFANLALGIILNVGGAYFIYRKKYLQKISNNEKQNIARISAFFLFFIFFLQLFVALPFVMPDKLQDGPYVFKNKNNLHIKIQALTGNLPADNYIPYVFSQFLLQKISFKKNRPMLPGQEVSNRTVLMGLNSAYFLSVFRMPEVPSTDKLGTFSYVGSKWPDVESFGDDNKSFSIFLTMAMIMNAAFLLSVCLLIGSIFGKNKGFGIMLILMVFPYTINQVIFTWPKFLMAYFLISAVYLVIKKSNPYVVGLFLALAFHSHPSAMIYIGFIVLYWLAQNFKINNKKTYTGFLKLMAVLIIIILPWIIWTKLIVKIPSDLITQNAATNDHSLYGLIKVRLDNLYLLFALGSIQATSLASKLFQEMTFTFAGAIGIYFFVSYFYVFKYIKIYYREILLLFLGPIVLLTMPWSRIFGCFSILFAQPAIPLFFAFSVMLFLKNRKISLLLLIVQVLISLYAFWFGMYNINLQIATTNMPDMLFGLSILLQVLFIILGTWNLFSGMDSSEEIYKPF